MPLILKHSSLLTYIEFCLKKPQPCRPTLALDFNVEVARGKYSFRVS